MRTLIVLLIICFAGYFLNHRHQRYKEYEGLQTTIKTAQQTLADRQKEIARNRDSIKPLAEAKKETEAPGGSPDVLEKEIADLKEVLKSSTAQLDAAEADFQKAMTEVREVAKKQTFPVLKLPAGDNTFVELKDCTITKFGEGFVSISHSEGNNKVAADDLPEGWIQKYSLDYVSQEFQAERQALTARVAEATETPLNLKNAKLEEIDARIADLNTQMLSIAAEMREARSKADILIRDAYRVALGQKGGDAAKAKRAALFDQSRKMEAGRLETQKKYLALRKQKQELEQARVEMKKKPNT